MANPANTAAARLSRVWEELSRAGGRVAANLRGIELGEPLVRAVRTGDTASTPFRCVKSGFRAHRDLAPGRAKVPGNRRLSPRKYVSTSYGRTPDLSPAPDLLPDRFSFAQSGAHAIQSHFAVAGVGTSYKRNFPGAAIRLNLLTFIALAAVARFMLSPTAKRIGHSDVGRRKACSPDATRHGLITTQGIEMAQSNDFSWSDESLIVVKRVDAIAVYKNPQGDIVVRQESRAGDEDNIIIVPAQYAYTLVESMQRLLKGQLFSLPVDPR